MRGAIIGFGEVAQKAHVPAFLERPAFSLTAIADPAEARRRAAADMLPSARLYDSIEDLLSGEKNLDFIVLCTPPFLHGRQVREALDKGLHVLCEKPLTLDPAELEEIEDLAARRDRAVYTVHNWAFSPIWRQAWETLESGALGQARHAELHVLRSRPAAGALPGNWRTDPALSGGGILVDHGWHNLYLLRRLLGGQDAELGSCRLLSGPSGADEEATLLLASAGATAVVHLTWRASERFNWALAYGSRGVLEIRDDLLLVRRAGEEERSFRFPEKLSAGSAHPSWNAAMLDDFRAEVEGRGRGGSLAEARFACRIIAAAYANAEAARQPPRAAACHD